MGRLPVLSRTAVVHPSGQGTVPAVVRGSEDSACDLSFCSGGVPSSRVFRGTRRAGVTLALLPSGGLCVLPGLRWAGRHPGRAGLPGRLR